LVEEKNQNSQQKLNFGESSTSKKLTFESSKKAPLEGSPSKELQTAQKEREHHIFKETNSNIVIE
jgi:hypothetical protein